VPLVSLAMRMIPTSLILASTPFRGLKALRAELTDLRAAHDHLTGEVQAGQEMQSAMAKGQDKMATLSTDLSQRIEELVAGLEATVRMELSFTQPLWLGLHARQSTFQYFFLRFLTLFPPPHPYSLPNAIDARAWLDSEA